MASESDTVVVKNPSKVGLTTSGCPNDKVVVIFLPLSTFLS